MKIRSGFVSNSSSSSYVLRVHNISERQFFAIAYDQIRGSQTYGDVNVDPKRYVIQKLTKITGWGSQKSVQVGINEVTVTGFSSMHNSYRDMPPVIAQLYFRFLENMKQMSFKRQDDY